MGDKKTGEWRDAEAGAEEQPAGQGRKEQSAFIGSRAAELPPNCACELGISSGWGVAS